MTDEPKLLPCPWCGHTNGLVKNPRGDVDCIRCGVGVPHEYWNKRAPDPVRDAMVRLCVAAKDMRDLYAYDISEAMRDALADLERARKGEG